MEDTKLERTVDKLESQSIVWKEISRLEIRADKNHELQKRQSGASGTQSLHAPVWAGLSTGKKETLQGRIGVILWRTGLI